ncbi:hypothetical protein D3C80_1868970 [compost metagenome]
MDSRLIACSALASAPRGGTSRAQDIPVGRITTWVAPRATAAEIGVLLAIPPSINGRPAMVTAGNTAGMAVLASSAGTASPEDRMTSVPSRTSVATT